MQEFTPPEPTATPLPTADVQATNQGPIEYEAFPVRKPEADLVDFKVQVRASQLRRCRTRLAAVSSARFPWYEFSLGLGTLAGGAALGSLPSSISPGTPMAILFYTILPVVSVGLLVAAFFLRTNSILSAEAAIKDALADIPDPDQTR